MLDSKKCVSHRHYIDFPGGKCTSSLLGKYLTELVYLLVPEDSTDKTGPWNNEAKRLKANNLWSVVKVVFWIAISVSISIVIGQLR